MPTCARCGTWNQDGATICDKCGAAITAAGPAAAVSPPPPLTTSAPTSKFYEWRRQRFFLFVALLVVLPVAGVLLCKSAFDKHDSSGPGTLDTNYTVQTETRNGSVESVKYVVTYKFDVNGKQYTGKDTISTEPTAPEVTVYYMADNPQENALSQDRVKTFNLVCAIVAFVLVLIAYGLLPKKNRFAAGTAPQAVVGVGDPGYEYLRMKRGKYDAWAHVHIAFFVQAALVASLAALVLAEVFHAEATSYTILGVATFVAIATTLWVYVDRWSCIEAFSSRFCSGLANFSILYVPGIAFVYANYRGLKKLRGR
ncbi:MAG: hypothetical protein ABSB30_00330 [Terracidiphilus sp.]